MDFSGFISVNASFVLRALLRVLANLPICKNSPIYKIESSGYTLSADLVNYQDGEDSPDYDSPGNRLSTWIIKQVNDAFGIGNRDNGEVGGYSNAKRDNYLNELYFENFGNAFSYDLRGIPLIVADREKEILWTGYSWTAAECDPKFFSG